MSLLSTVSTPKPRAPIITIVGEAGTGKSSLAAAFPKPVFIRAEDGVGRITKKVKPPQAFPPVKTGDQLFDQLMALAKEEHDFLTAVVDSVSRLDEIFTRDILEKDGRAKTLATALGGYGAGYQALTAMHNRVLKAAHVLNDKGMAVIFIAHADLETMRLPDQDDFQRYSLRLGQKSIPPYIEDVDLVGYTRLVSVTRGEDGERKRVISDGSREFVCHKSASSVSKNGLGITEPIPFEEGTNPLAEALGIPAKTEAKKAKTETKEEENEQ